MRTGFPPLHWRKSSYSGGQSGQCVEVAAFTPVVAIRDSKDPDGPKLIFGTKDWHAFSVRVKSGHLDLA